MTARSSLTGHLLAWILGALLVVWGGFIVFGYRTGQHEADELTDGHLATVGALLVAAGVSEFKEPFRTQAPAGPLRLKAHDYEQSLSVVVWDGSGRLLARSGDAPLPSFVATQEGLDTLQLGQPPTAWRVFGRWSPDGTRKVMVLLSMQHRDAMARDIAEQIVEPGLWLLPAIALALVLAVRRGLQPLHEMSRRVHALDVQHAETLPLPPQDELATAVDAVNRLVERYHAALTHERELASEFAHELRTPLTALALQARTLRDDPQLAAREADIARLEQQALRAGEVLTHLLALARARHAELTDAAQWVDIHEVAREVMAQLAPQAHAGGRELALVGEAPLRVMGHATLLEMALRNLVENSLSHTPPGTFVEVCVEADQHRIWVRDHWPTGVTSAHSAAGMPSLGLGLGHRVVRKVAGLHGARFERLDVADAPSGHCYGITFAAGSSSMVIGREQMHAQGARAGQLAPDATF